MKKLSCLLLALLLTLTPLAGGIVLPTAADDTAPKITPAPHAYAQGLAAWYAGEQNTRAGQNPESTVWEDLIGGYDMTVRTDAKTRFTAEGLALESSKQYFPQEVCGIVNGSAFTVEIRLGAFATIGDAYNTFMNSDNDNFALFRRNSNNVLEFKWAAVGAGQRPTVENGLAVLQDALVSITYEVGGEVVLYINGTRAAARDCTAAMGADNLFIGHVGVLLSAEDGSLYFIEKVAFQEPYRLVKIQNRTELSDYLMEKYDTAWGQDTTRSFIMENDELMDGYLSLIHI